MLTTEDRRRIESFVAQEPRSMQELARFLDRNWRTVDRYVEQIEQDFGTVTTKVFRKGTRGSLKVVYWAAVERPSANAAQRELESRIMNGRAKGDFSPFDIYQYTDAQLAQLTDEEDNIDEYGDELRGAQRQLLLFSGNLSFMNLGVADAMEDLLARGVQIKVLARVDVESEPTVRKALEMSRRHAGLLEVRHAEQPLRGAIIDDRVMRIKEARIGSGKEHERSGPYFIFYRITDRDWIVWATRIFWNIYNRSIAAEHRLKKLATVRDAPTAF